MHNTTIYSNLKGGLGNQIFQIAAGLKYAKLHDKEFVAYSGCWGAGQGNSPSTYTDTIFKNIKISQTIYGDFDRFAYDETVYSEIPIIEGNIIIDGYWQCIEYVDIQQMRDVLEVPAYDTSDNVVAIHIRRGDYLRVSSIHLVCDTEYYLKCMSNFPNTEFHIITDDESFVAKEFDMDKYNMKFVECNNDLDAFNKLANYRKVIISNSSFSWWATQLGVKCDIIYSPDKWFANNFESELPNTENFIQIIT